MNIFEPTHLIIVALVVLVLFGPKKIPELMRGLGQGMSELKKGVDEGKRQLNAAMEASTTPEATPLKVTPASDAVPAGEHASADVAKFQNGSEVHQTSPQATPNPSK